MLTFCVNVLFVTKMTCKCAQETSSQCQLSHSVHTFVDVLTLLFLKIQVLVNTCQHFVIRVQ